MTFRAIQWQALVCLPLFLLVYLPSDVYSQPVTLTGFSTEMQLQLSSTKVVLEGSVNPDEYILGPGDTFSVTMSGLIPIPQIISVSVAGDLTLPEVGLIPAAGRTLAEVKRDALRELRKRYANVSVGIALVQARMFYVHLSGAVPNPGRYLMRPISRVNDAVNQGFTSNDIQNSQSTDAEIMGRPVMKADYRPALRNVVITRRDSTQFVVDLLQYYINGDMEQNPFLRDGDVIMVPAYSTRRDGVRISGDIAFPGIYDLKPSDTLLNLLSLASGPDEEYPIANINLARTDSTGQLLHLSYSVQELTKKDALPVPVKAGDHIVVSKEVIANAAIQGLVVYPGTYRIKEGSTTLRELVDMAGGLKPSVNIRAAFLERRKTLNFPERGRSSDLDFFSRYYAETFVTSPATRVNVDIAAALESDSIHVHLYDGDRLVFPRDESTVHVYGHVRKPGFVAFKEGETAAYYIDVAGGKGDHSRNTYVYTDGSDDVRIGDHHIVGSGDTIFIDRTDVAETPEIAQLLLAERHNKRLVRVQTTQVIVGSVTAITGIVTAVVAILNTR